MSLRVPQEPDPARFPDRKGVVLPVSLDFAKALGEDQVRSFVMDNVRLGVDLTNVFEEKEKYAEYIHFLEDAKKTVKVDGKEYELSIKVEKVDVAGSPDKDLYGIRHTCRIPIRKDYFLDVVSRLSYTNALDKYMFFIQEVADVAMKPEDKIDWSHLVYTADQLIAPFLFSVREFVTLDYGSHEYSMAGSRSCLHPDRPVTEHPTWNLFESKDRRYRVPLLHYNRVLEDPSGDPNACVLVQFQYSDVGGVVACDRQIEAVREFGTDNIPNMFRIAQQAKNKNLPLGEGTNGYLDDPLRPEWRKEVSDMIPGL